MSSDQATLHNGGWKMSLTHVRCKTLANVHQNQARPIKKINHSSTGIAIHARISPVAAGLVRTDGRLGVLELLFHASDNCKGEG